MRKYKTCLALIVAFLTAHPADAAEIVYPKTDNVIINSPVTFFVGSENPDMQLKINNNEVKIHPSGGFFYPVKLNTGENIFKIDNGKEIKTYIILRPEASTAQQDEPKTINYSKPAVYVVKKDNVPLRSTPYDGGLNRLQHFDKGLPLNIVGEHGDFYKVQLARDDYAWIAKDSCAKAEGYNNSPAKIESYTYEETPEKRVFTLKLSKKVPYIISESRYYKLSETNYKYLPQAGSPDLTVYNIDGLYENKFDFHINKTGRPFGYNTYYKNSKELVIEIKNFPVIDKEKPLSGLKITLDPGHGGSEYGAIGCLGDKEKDIDLAIGLKLKDYLETSGATVYMTRNNDVDVSLSDRVKFSQENNSDIFISIHNNALPDSMANSGRSGSSVYYFYPQSRELAEKIQEKLTSELGMADDKVRAESLAVVRNTQSLAVLVEVGYMISPEDNAKLIDCEFQDKAAQAILHGLENYINDIQQ